jgi:hypothetical protein
MHPVAFGDALPADSRLTLFSDDKPDRFFTVIKFWMDETSAVALALKTGVPSYQVEDKEGRTHLLIHLPIEEDGGRWCLWRSHHGRSLRVRWWRNRKMITGRQTGTNLSLEFNRANNFALRS